MAILAELPHAHGGPCLTAVLRQQPADFQVEEILGFEPEGQGEHVFLQIEKRGLTTAAVVARLAGFAGIARRRISYSGMKDKQAVTRQWFSVHLPGKDDLNWQTLDCDELIVLRSARHRRKLRRGSHRGNRFQLRLRECCGEWSRMPLLGDIIRQHGVPNYFTEQRFGVGFANVAAARAWFAGGAKPDRQQRGFYLSAARSWLFNRVLAKRVEESSWDRLLPEEVVMLNGSQSHFIADDVAALAERLATGDVHPSGPLPGVLDADALSAQQWRRERRALAGDNDLIEGLQIQRVQHQRRPLRVIPTDLDIQRSGEDQLLLSFCLGRGSYATAVVRELADYQLPERG